MFVKYLRDCTEFIGGDNSILRELLHPDKADLKIRYSLAYAKVPAGQKTTAHKLRASEVYYILSGSGLMHINQNAQNVSAQCALYIPPGAVQFIENSDDSDLEFLCIVDPAWQEADEQVLGSFESNKEGC
jgi:mannose-6-phosphate isomerase-like protein (cupin superfamily)